MKIIVLGSGVVGVANAWYLAQAGHEVTVVDRQTEVAKETSYGNAGQISPGYSAPWAAPGIPLKAAKWLAQGIIQDLSPFRIGPRALDLKTLSWMGQMLSNCSEAKYHTNKARMMRIAEYSRDCFVDLRKQLDLHYDGRQQGTLQVFRTQKQLDGAAKDISVLEECGVAHELLDINGCVAAEPALDHVRNKIVGGLRLPNDETGDCFKFTQALAQACKQAGVTFLMDTQIKALKGDTHQITSVVTDKGELTADAYVMALGSYSRELLAPLNIHIPVIPVKGFSLTLPILDESRAPVSTVMDETYKVAITRFDDRIRVGGTAEITGFNTQLPEKRRANVEHSVNDLFTGATDTKQAEFWSGLRPMTPDGTPVLGKTHLANLFLNTGHGTLGWTMSLGSGKYLADVISQRSPDISPEGLDVNRYEALRA